MTKSRNTEWGSVAYLQHSKYGSETSLRSNNHSGYLTGYAAVKEPTCGYTGDSRECNKFGNTSNITLPYNTETGYLASTTGNISGIYDMSGGSWEYVMGVMTDHNGNPLSGQNASANSGFTGEFGEGGTLTIGYSWSKEKYYDSYQYGANYSDYTRRILGDATGEMGPFQSITYANNIERRISSWYDDNTNFMDAIRPWIVRGGDYRHGSESGMFATGNNTGATNAWDGFRIVLTP